jgi:hypothetical protein
LVSPVDGGRELNVGDGSDLIVLTKRSVREHSSVLSGSPVSELVEGKSESVLVSGILNREVSEGLLEDLRSEFVE